MVADFYFVPPGSSPYSRCRPKLQAPALPRPAQATLTMKAVLKFKGAIAKRVGELQGRSDVRKPLSYRTEIAQASQYCRLWALLATRLSFFYYVYIWYEGRTALSRSTESRGRQQYVLYINRLRQPYVAWTARSLQLTVFAVFGVPLNPSTARPTEYRLSGRAAEIVPPQLKDDGDPLRAFHEHALFGAQRTTLLRHSGVPSSLAWIPPHFGLGSQVPKVY